MPINVFKMAMKPFIYIALLFLLSCCNKQEIYTILEDKKTSPIVQETDISEILYPDKLGFSDSCLVVINRKSEPFFYIYDKKTFLPKEKFGFAGNGPEDFIFPFFLEQIDTVSKTTAVYDVNLASFKDINISHLLAHQDSAIITSPMPPSLIGSSVLIKNKDIYYGNIDSGEGLFFIYNRQTDTREWTPFPASLLPAEGDFTVMNANRIAANPILGKIVSGMRYYNKLFLYDIKTRKILKEAQIGNEEVSPIVHNQSLDGNSKLCCMEIHVSKQYIYILMQNIKEKDWEQPEGAASRIIVLDWNLNYVRTYQLAHHTNSFAVDSSCNRILYTATDYEGNTKLYYWTETIPALPEATGDAK